MACSAEACRSPSLPTLSKAITLNFIGSTRTDPQHFRTPFSESKQSGGRRRPEDRVIASFRVPPERSSPDSSLRRLRRAVFRFVRADAIRLGGGRPRARVRDDAVLLGGGTQSPLA